MDKVTVIGGMNLDICSSSDNELIINESNIGKISFSVGGVGTNIFINLFRLGANVEFITSVGNDFLSNYCLSYLNSLNINTDLILVNHDKPMSIYSYILNNNDMLVAINDMSTLDLLDVNYLKKHQDKLDQSNYIVIDTNLRQDVILWLCNTYSQKILVDGVSYTKVKKIKDCLNKIHTIKLNNNELASLFELDKIDKDKIPNYIIKLYQKGIKNIFVSNGIDGIYFNDFIDNKLVVKKVVNINNNVVNANGSGDGLASGIFYSVNKNLSKEIQVKNGLKITNLTLETNNSTSNKVNDKTLM